MTKYTVFVDPRICNTILSLLTVATEIDKTKIPKTVLGNFAFFFFRTCRVKIIFGAQVGDDECSTLSRRNRVFFCFAREKKASFPSSSRAKQILTWIRDTNVNNYLSLVFGTERTYYLHTGSF